MEVLSLLEKGAFYQVNPISKGFYSRLFTVPKRTGCWRPVLDLSPLNRYLRKVKFKIEIVADIRLAIQPNDWATSIDLRDALFSHRHLCTDASGQFWGAHSTLPVPRVLRSKAGSEIKSPILGFSQFWGLWPGRLQSNHINFLKLMLVFLALKHKHGLGTGHLIPLRWSLCQIFYPLF